LPAGDTVVAGTLLRISNAPNGIPWREWAARQCPPGPGLTAHFEMKARRADPSPGTEYAA